MLTWVVVQHGKVIDAEARCRGFIGRTLDEVRHLILSHGDQIYRVASCWHTCVEWPWDDCEACKQGNPEPDRPQLYHIDAKQP